MISFYVTLVYKFLDSINNLKNTQLPVIFIEIHKYINSNKIDYIMKIIFDFRFKLDDLYADNVINGTIIIILTGFK